MITPRAPLTRCGWGLVRSSRPSGIPNSVEKMSRPVLRRWIFFQSCRTTMAAMVIEISTLSGAATLRGRKKARSGTAMRASPKPKVDRIRVARKMMRRTRMVARSMVDLREAFVGFLCIL
jgi:hypothetical protein